MHLDEKRVKFLNDLNAPFYDFEASWMGFSDNSSWRREAVHSLDLVRGARVLDIGCGTGLNFRMIEERIGPEGSIVGVDITKGMLDRARKRCLRRGWDNVELVHESISRFRTKTRFDAAICTFTLESIHNYKMTIDHILTLLKSTGRLVVMGTKTTAHVPLSAFNIPYVWLCKAGGLDVDRDVPAYISSKCEEMTYKEFWGGFCYLLTAVRSHRRH